MLLRIMPFGSSSTGHDPMSHGQYRVPIRPPSAARSRSIFSSTAAADRSRTSPLLNSVDATSYAVAIVAVVVVALLAAILRRIDMQGLGLLAFERTRRLRGKPGLQSQLKQDSSSEAARQEYLRQLLHPEEEDVDVDVDLDGSRYTYPGLLNTSTTCYLNSTLQALASCPSFIAYLRAILSSTDTHLEFTTALYTLLKKLNTGSMSSSVIRTDSIVYSLMNSSSASNASRNRKRIMQGSGQQDAQEFYLILAETVEEEKKVVFEELRKRKDEKAGFPELVMPMDFLQALTRIVSRHQRA